MLGTNEILTSKHHVANGQTRALNDVIACEQAFGRAIFFPKKNREKKEPRACSQANDVRVSISTLNDV